MGRSNCDRKSQLSEILTEPLNPCWAILHQLIQGDPKNYGWDDDFQAEVIIINSQI